MNQTTPSKQKPLHASMLQTIYGAAHGETRNFRGWHITTHRTPAGTIQAWTAHHQHHPHPPVVCHTRHQLAKLILAPHPPLPTPPTLQQTLQAGLRWLHHTVQPTTAVLNHHGTPLPTTLDNRKIHCIPTPTGKALITINVTRLRWVHNGTQLHPTDRLDPTELAHLADLLDQAGSRVAQTLNGYPTVTGTLVLKTPAHPSLVAAVHRYQDGCPTHPNRGSACSCGWYERGHAQLIQPTP